MSRRSFLSDATASSRDAPWRFDAIAEEQGIVNARARSRHDVRGVNLLQTHAGQSERVSGGLDHHGRKRTITTSGISRPRRLNTAIISGWCSSSSRTLPWAPSSLVGGAIWGARCVGNGVGTCSTVERVTTRRVTRRSHILMAGWVVTLPPVPAAGQVRRALHRRSYSG